MKNKKLLKDLEEIIESKGFEHRGNALRIIRDNRLHIPYFLTFEKYCKRRWSISTTHAEQLIASAQVMYTLRSNLITILPRTEYHASPLAKLSLSKGIKAWEEIVRTHPGSKIRVAFIKVVVRRYLKD